MTSPALSIDTIRIAADRAEARAREVLRRARLARLDHLTDLSNPTGRLYDDLLGAGVALSVAQATRDGGRSLVEATRRLGLATDALERLLPAVEKAGRK